MTTTGPEATVVDEVRHHEVALRRIHQAFCRMPFGGLAMFDQPAGTAPGRVLTLEQIASNLDRLVEVLNRVVDEHEDERAELGKYRRLVSAMREVASLFTDPST